MKTKLFITMVCLIFSAFAFGQNKQPSKAEIKATKVENMINSGYYEITVNQANPMSGNVIHLAYNYSVRVSGDSVYISLPYFGRVYSTPYGGEGGIKIASLMNDYKVNFRKKKSYSIDFKSKSAIDIYKFSIDLTKNGMAFIHVICNNRQTISYSGEIISIKRP